MVTQAEARGYHESVASLAVLAQAELVTFWRALDLSDAREVQRELAAALPVLVEAFGAPMTALAVDWYEEIRERAQVAGAAYVAAPAAVLMAEELASLAGYAAGALYGVAPSPELALSRLAGGFQRHVTNAARDTIEGNAALDPVRPKFARYASANACAFCRMLATRGAVYASEESAARITGRRGRARGTRSLGSKYHDFCRCVPVPVFPGQEYEPAPYIADWQEQYADSVVTSGKRGAIDLKATLARWREQFDTH